MTLYRVLWDDGERWFRKASEAYLFARATPGAEVNKATLVSTDPVFLLNRTGFIGSSIAVSGWERPKVVFGRTV